MNTATTATPPRSATINACKLCSPLGAAMVFKGIKGCLPFLHGSQGCATYIRRYMISHFREPVDIASSSFSEEDAIFGGAQNFATGISNVIKQYDPELIGVATTCLSETIGDNMLGMIHDYQKEYAGDGPPLVHVSTPAYAGTHSEGFHATVLALVKHFVSGDGNKKQGDIINLLPGMVSCEDLRFLKETCSAFGLTPILLPDYSETLEGENWDAYHRISPGGTTIGEIAEMGQSKATLELGHTLMDAKFTAGGWLESECNVSNYLGGMPIGIRLSDIFYKQLETISAKSLPRQVQSERARLVDAYVDAHKYLAGQRALIFGDPDLVSSLAAFLSEIGVTPVVCATGAKPPKWKERLSGLIEGDVSSIRMMTGADHAAIRSAAIEAKPDFILGSSKAFPLAREIKVPLIRIGFPIHDRFGAQRQLLLGYRGTQELFDRIVNTVLETKQNANSTGYSYL